ncbi:MAG: N-acetylneuraminate synthase family protein, partial [Armatimonadota bacterium]
LVGADQPAYIIVEGGVNHQCNLDRALEMIRQAARAGADAIKFQTYKAETLTTRTAPTYWDHAEPGITQYDVFADSDKFGPDEYAEMARCCRDEGIHFLSTPFDLDAVDLLVELGAPALKIASADLTCHPLLRKAAATGKPMLVSTGASTLDEIREALDVIHAEGNDNVVLLHCVLCYPTPADQICLRRIPLLQQTFPDAVVGISNHTEPDPNMAIDAAAAALGAKAFERHYTLDRTLEGPDHFFSVDPPLVRRHIEAIRTVERALGDPYDEPLECELPARQYARRSIVAKQDIPQGARLTPEMLIMKRPGTGISPRDLDRVTQMTARHHIPADAVIQWDDLAEP